MRPEVKEGLLRWREALVGSAVSIFGIYWAANGLGFISAIGTVLAIAGALLVFAGIQRARFRVGTGGSGVVYVDEGQVSYFGPVSGGSLAVADLQQIEFDPTVKPHAEWVLHDHANVLLRIPTNAEGADALFDVFSGLEGLHTEKMLSGLRNDHGKRVVIWQSKVVALH